MSTLAFVLLVIAVLMIGAVLGIVILAIMIGGAAHAADGEESVSDFDTSIKEWGYIGDRRRAGDL